MDFKELASLKKSEARRADAMDKRLRDDAKEADAMEKRLGREAPADVDVGAMVEKLKALSKKLHVYGVERLVIAAQREKIEAPSLSVLREAARIALGTEPVKQIFQPPNRSTGAVAASAKDEVWVLDLADLSTYKQANRPQGADYIFVCVDVFSRFMRTAGIPDTKAESTAAVFSKWTQNVKPKLVDTDGGGEFAGAFDRLLKAKEIAHRLKTKHGTNHLAVVDRKIQQLKTLIVNEMIENSKQGDPLPVWNTFLESVTAGINAAPTEKLLGESPDSVKDIKDGEKSSDPAQVLNFQLQASNAEAMKLNVDKSETQFEKLAAGGAFRPILRDEAALTKGGPNRRGFIPNFSGNVIQIDKLGKNFVEGGGKKHRIGDVLPVNQKSKSVNIPRELATGSTKMDLLLRDRLQTPMDNLLAYFQMNKGTTLKWTDVQRILKKDGAQDKDIKTSNLPRIMRLFPVFLFTDSSGAIIQKGSKGPYRVSIPASQENVEGDADGLPVVPEDAPPALAREEGARGRLRNRIWGRGRIRGSGGEGGGPVSPVPEDPPDVEVDPPPVPPGPIAPRTPGRRFVRGMLGTRTPGSAPGTPAPGTPAPGTPAPGTPAPGTPAPGTPGGGREGARRSAFARPAGERSSAPEQPPAPAQARLPRQDVDPGEGIDANKTSSLPQQRFQWMLENDKAPANMPYMRAYPDKRWEYTLTSGVSEKTQNVIDADVRTMRELIQYVEQRIRVRDPEYTKAPGTGKKGDATSRAEHLYNTLVQGAYIYMDEDRPEHEKYNVANAIRRRKRDYAPKAAAKAAPQAAGSRASGSRD